MTTSIFTITLTNGADTYSSAGLSVDIPITIDALAGNDFVTVTGGWETICYMADGDDTVRVNNSTYVHVYGENGNDRVDMYASSVLFVGAAGNDLVNVYGGVHLSADGGIGSDRVNFYANIAADVSGGDGNDLFYGNGHAITGMINGNAGDDQFAGFVGTAVTLAGGAGNDSYTIGAGTLPKIVESLAAGTDTVNASVTYTLPVNVERLVLTGTGGISGTGNGLANTLSGNSGANALSGADGNDTLSGQGGADSLNGGTGSDWLEGGAGKDSLYGGSGADSFAFRNGDFGGATTATCDQIHDFSHAQGDRIQLASVDAKTGLTGDQAFAFIGTSAFHHVAGELRYQVISGNTYVQGDTNGDGVPDFMIQLDGSQTLTAADFVL